VSNILILAVKNDGDDDDGNDHDRCNSACYVAGIGSVEIHSEFWWGKLIGDHLEELDTRSV
jgi:hypothetical protein